MKSSWHVYKKIIWFWYDLNGTNLDWRCFQQNCHDVVLCVENKVPGMTWNSTEYLTRNNKKSSPKMKTRGPTPYPRGWGACPPPLGAPPCLVGPLQLRRPQLQLHIFRFTEKKIKEEVSLHFTIRSHHQALISLRRADLESVWGSGEGDLSPSSSSAILHHQFHDAHRRAWVIQL